MRYAYTPQAGDGQARPLLPVEISGTASTVALVDSGAINTLVPSWIAAPAGIDLDDVAPREVRIGSGLHARFITVQLNAAGASWEAEVGFSEHPMLERWGVLGHLAFCRYNENPAVSCEKRDRGRTVIAPPGRARHDLTDGVRETVVSLIA